MPDVELVHQPVGRLAVERDRPQQPAQHAMRGHARVLRATAERDDHIAVDIAEAPLPLAIGVAGVGAGPLAAPPRATREGPDPRVGTERPGKGADPLRADVVQR